MPTKVEIGKPVNQTYVINDGTGTDIDWFSQLMSAWSALDGKSGGVNYGLLSVPKMVTTSEPINSFTIFDSVRRGPEKGKTHQIEIKMTLYQYGGDVSKIIKI
jgi:hypothetical protein